MKGIPPPPKNNTSVDLKNLIVLRNKKVYSAKASLFKGGLRFSKKATELMGIVAGDKVNIAITVTGLSGPLYVAKTPDGEHRVVHSSGVHYINAFSALKTLGAYDLKDPIWSVEAVPSVDGTEIFKLTLKS